jgi:hypothetical protein
MRGDEVGGRWGVKLWLRVFVFSKKFRGGRIEFRGLVSGWYNSRKRGREGEEGEQMFMGRI